MRRPQRQRLWGHSYGGQGTPGSHQQQKAQHSGFYSPAKMGGDGEGRGVCYAVVDATLKTGFTSDEIGKIGGGDFLRIFGEAVRH